MRNLAVPTLNIFWGGPPWPLLLGWGCEDLMAELFRCAVCELEEAKCLCDKYCGMCQGAHDVRLCKDGLYYCLECREACDMQAQYQ